MPWHNGGTGVREGMIYGGRFKLVGQTIYDQNSPSSRVPLQQPQPATKQASGYWRTVCHGSHCTREWVSLGN